MEESLEKDPNNHFVWNKYGGALANANKPNEAITAYLNALKLRPNYTRTYVNMGVVHSIVRQRLKASEAFLNALILNPKADHVWSYLREALKHTDRKDLKDKVDAKDPMLFKDDFKLVDPDNLPKP